MPLVTYSDGSTYDGDLVGDVRHGQGTYTWEKGDTYTGTFVDGARTGEGNFTWYHGVSYIGTFVDGALTGEGVKTWTNGNSYSGTFVDGVYFGRGRSARRACWQPRPPACRGDPPVGAAAELSLGRAGGAAHAAPCLLWRDARGGEAYAHVRARRPPRPRPLSPDVPGALCSVAQAQGFAGCLQEGGSATRAARAVRDDGRWRGGRSGDGARPSGHECTAAPLCR